MSLLPKTTSEFTDPKFWRHFFERRKAPFEWYGNYDILASVLEKYLRPTDTILQIGCGNSRLAEEMYDNGFRSIHSIDTDSAVIEEQRSRNRKRPELLFKADDATSLSFGDDDFSVVIDKGTLDSLLPPQATEQQTESVRRMFREVERVLKEVGRYLVVTLAQHHIVKFWVDHFLNTRRFLLRVHEVENRASSFSMPVFIFVATKLRNSMNVSMPIELFLQGSDRVERVSNPEDLLPLIISEQELSQFVHLCSRRLEHQASIAIESRLERGPRYRFHIVDNIKAETIRSYAVFIVPLGRENEWLFSSEKGRSALRDQTGKDRLVVVTLSRSQNYSSLEQVQNELSPFATRFDPRKNSGLIDFLSCGDVDARTPCACGNSSLNGDWVVEDVISEGQEYRRLIFLSSSHVVQSEAYLISGKGGKKTVNLDSLSCDHHSLMLAGLSIMPRNPLADPSLIPLRFAILGLGGGVLASFLLRHFKKAHIDGIELDPDIVKVAVQWFALPEKDPRINIDVTDALAYLEHAVRKQDDDKLDVLFVDLAGPVHESGLSCPPAVFLTDSVLSNMRNSTKKDGMVALNMVTRDEEVASKARHSIAVHFPALYHLHSNEDVNEVLFGCAATCENFDPLKFSRSLRKDIRWVNDLAPIVARITPVSLES
ncbi:hypothetical protein KIN20_018331 [Parelaphostrongylus tenuis]|uniref:Methyltransferase type 11 domain-containing protein n=1 Tax=Parelaphostrongylus tenuis TaxID=148309 RepID=A0AAD5N3J3_PARTN|nr:hypothetical protein KIN20_018331 [Parelaphostrongylus tenuis]